MNMFKSTITVIIFALFVRLLIVLASTERNVFKFQQNDYKVQFERLELNHYNERYLESVNIVTFKYNRTTPVANASFALKEALGNRLQVIVQAYKFMSNEYRVFPLHFEVNFCDAFKNNLIGIANSMKCGNFTGCPLGKDINYYICNWTVDERQFPPLLPDGKYMVDLNGYHNGVDVGNVHLYLTISRPILII